MKTFHENMKIVGWSYVGLGLGWATIDLLSSTACVVWAWSWGAADCNHLKNNSNSLASVPFNSKHNKQKLLISMPRKVPLASFLHANLAKKEKGNPGLPTFNFSLSLCSVKARVQQRWHQAPAVSNSSLWNNPVVVKFHHPNLWQRKQN